MPSRRSTSPARILCILSWCYSGMVLLWIVFHGALGDSVWWLALVNAFVPYLFLPLVLFVAAALALRQRTLLASILLPILIFLALYGHLFLPRLRPATDATQPAITVVSFNLWAFSRQPELLDLVLGDGSADIVALQEVSPQMWQLLERTAIDTYPYRLYDDTMPPFGLAIISRHPITPVALSHLSGSEGHVLAANVNVNGHYVLFYNLHLPALNALAYADSGRPMAVQIDPVVRQRADLVDRLAACIQSRSLPVIVAGDLNGTDQGDPHRLLATVVTDAHDAAGWGFGHTFPSYSGRWRGIPIPSRLMRLDMVFHSDEFVALECAPIRELGESDHHPVSAVLAWRGSSAFWSGLCGHVPRLCQLPKALLH